MPNNIVCRYRDSTGRAGESERDANPRELRAAAENQAEHLRSLGAERHAHADLLRARDHGVGEHAVDADRRQHAGDAGKYHQQRGVETLTRHRRGEQPIGGLDRIDADRRIEPLHGLAHERDIAPRIAGGADDERLQADRGLVGAAGRLVVASRSARSSAGSRRTPPALARAPGSRCGCLRPRRRPASARRSSRDTSRFAGRRPPARCRSTSPRPTGSSPPRTARWRPSLSRNSRPCRTRISSAVMKPGADRTDARHRLLAHLLEIAPRRHKVADHQLLGDQDAVPREARGLDAGNRAQALQHPGHVAGALRHVDRCRAAAAGIRGCCRWCSQGRCASVARSCARAGRRRRAARWPSPAGRRRETIACSGSRRPPPAPRVPIALQMIRARQLQRRQQAADDAVAVASAKRDGEHAQIDGQLGGSRQQRGAEDQPEEPFGFGHRQLPDEPHARRRRSARRQRRRRREDRAFSGDQPDDAPAAGPNGGANRDLAAARGAARQQQVRHVRADDQQHHGRPRRASRATPAAPGFTS